MSLNLKGKVITVRPEETITTKQNLPYYIGISQATAGSTALSMNLTVMPPGGSPKGVYHIDVEAAM